MNKRDHEDLGAEGIPMTDQHKQSYDDAPPRRPKFETSGEDTSWRNNWYTKLSNGRVHFGVSGVSTNGGSVAFQLHLYPVDSRADLATVLVDLDALRDMRDFLDYVMELPGESRG
jgi:hypothetical protein